MLYRGYLEIMEKRMETTIQGLGFRGDDDGGKAPT